MAYSVDNWRRTQAFDLAVVQSFGAFSPGGRFLAAADSNSIEVRDARSGTISATVEMVGVTSLAVSPDGRLLVAADDEGTVNAWTLPARVALMARPSGPATSRLCPGRIRRAVRGAGPACSCQ